MSKIILKSKQEKTESKYCSKQSNTIPSMVPRPNKVFPAGTWWCQSWPGECGHPPQIHPPPQSQVLLSETIPEKNGKIYNYIRIYKEV
jgi:hypothetical protein